MRDIADIVGPQNSKCRKIVFGFCYDIYRALFYFEVCFCKIFAHDADAEQLHAAAKQEDTNKAWPSRSGVSKYEGTNHDKQYSDECSDAKKDSCTGSNEKGSS